MQVEVEKAARLGGQPVASLGGSWERCPHPSRQKELPRTGALTPARNPGSERRRSPPRVGHGGGTREERGRTGSPDREPECSRPGGPGGGETRQPAPLQLPSAPGGGAALTTLDRAAGRGSGRRRRRHFPKVSAARSRRGWGPGVGAVGSPPAARGREAGRPFTSVASRLRAAPQASAPRPRVPATPQPHPRSGRRGN